MLAVPALPVGVGGMFASLRRGAYVLADGGVAGVGLGHRLTLYESAHR